MPEQNPSSTVRTSFDENLVPPYVWPEPLQDIGSFKLDQLSQCSTDSSRQILNLGPSFQVGFACVDAEKQARWYKEAFGFVEDRRNDFKEFGTVVIMMRYDTPQGFQLRVEFIQQPEGFVLRRPNPTSHTVFSGVCQFQFWVNNIDEVYQRIVDRGDIEVSWGPIDVGAGLRMKHLFVRDPESNIVLITEPY